MLAQCEADEMDGKSMVSNKVKGPKVSSNIYSHPDTSNLIVHNFAISINSYISFSLAQPLSSMPVLEKNGREYEQLEHEDDSENDDNTSPTQKRSTPAKQWSRPTSRSKSVAGKRSRSLARPTSNNKLTGEVNTVSYNEKNFDLHYIYKGYYV